MSSAEQHPPATTTGAIPRPRRRVPFWDNARFACVILVVLGHGIQRLTYDSQIAESLYLVIYAFHMPAFAIISGYFSKSISPNRRQMARVITDILVPYVIFEMLWMLTKWLVEGQADPNLTQPSWTLWFLLALGIFRLVLPYLALLRWPLVWALAISIGVGYMSNVDSTFSLSRTLGLLFFFTLGWWLSEHDIVQRFQLIDYRPWWLRAGAVAVLAAWSFAVWNWVDVWHAVDLRQWFFYDDSYAELTGGLIWWAGGVRLVVMTLAIVLSAAFFVLIPRRGQWWTTLGQYTMYVYLLHSFVLYPFRESGVLRGLDPTWFWLPAVTLLSVATTFVLASKPVRRLFRPLIEPRPRWMFADPDVIGAGHRNDPTGSRRSG
ncbi:acyltransferase family protein [Microbacterium esteraromaticum]|uniref:acyltransferase family protein n=1 Tax=Microbacterium esteraromaticum TaxID=57043 RepID=UPI001C979C9F|nr:acyltransferase family protein [Microbacterium esteraromaticum]MBY6060841.1 acyltransferase family protein [Microbacterium esteraromaticum]